MICFWLPALAFAAQGPDPAGRNFAPHGRVSRAGVEAGSIPPAARKSIDAGNQAWIDGMKNGDAAIIAATYTEEALDCGSNGECIQGRKAVEQKMKDRIAKLGQAQSASVTSAGSVQQGGFVYEWGRADASFPNGVRIGGHYLTVWQRQPDGTWKIFRNMAIPADR